MSFCNADFTAACSSRAECQVTKHYTDRTLPHAMERESWLLLTPPLGLRRHLGARSTLFDLGASRYSRGPGGASTSWFVEAFGAVGVTFDDIFAYEATPVDAAAYWSEVPARVRPALHYYNHPADAIIGSPRNPLTLMAAVCRRCDFLVVKIDVDVSELEASWIDQIKSSRHLTTCIDVLFFEHHVGEPHAMATNWWGGRRYASAGNVTTSFRLFGELRRLGILAHSWP